MASLISPGVSVTVTESSQFVPAGGVTTPLIVMATASEKLNSSGDPALGTYESGVVRTITSLTQSVRLYGTPVFKTDADGNPMHGDARNEYGLFTLNHFLGAGAKAYTVRAPVNLNDDRETLDELWLRKMTHNVTNVLDPLPLGLAYIIESRVQSYLDNLNADNGILDPLDIAYKSAVNSDELLAIISEVLEENMGIDVDGLNVYFDNDTFRYTRPTFYEDQTSLPLTMYDTITSTPVANGDYYLGVEGSAVDPTYPVNAGVTSTLWNKVLTISNVAEAIETVNQIKLVHNDYNTTVNGVPAGYDFIVRKDGGNFSDVTSSMKIVISNAEDSDNDNNPDKPYYKVYSGGTFLTSTYIENDTLILESAGGSPEDVFATSSGGTMNATNPDISAVMQIFPATYQSYEVIFDNNGASPAQDTITVTGYDFGTDVVAGDKIRVTLAENVDNNRILLSNAYTVASVAGDVITLESGSDVANDASPGVIDTSCVLEFFHEEELRWDAGEARDFFIAVSEDYQMTMEYINATSLGATDAQRRATIVKALKSVIVNNEDIRSETYEYNLVLCPGFYECTSNLVSLAQELKDEVFVIGDVPMNKNADAVVEWMSTTNRVTSFNLAYYYPHGMGTNLDGSEVLVPSSAIALRTYAFSDSISDLWWAPAGTTRGLVTGIDRVGYVRGTLGTATTFVELALNQGQRDNMYDYYKNLNPIVAFPQRGIIVWGQKTAGNAAQATDRVNVARLVGYLKRALRKASMPFVFQPNTQLTRDNIVAMFTGLLNDIVVKQGLYDFIVVSDESLNTSDRIDRNELYVYVGIKPTKAAEFIYVPIQVLTTGADI